MSRRAGEPRYDELLDERGDTSAPPRCTKSMCYAPVVWRAEQSSLWFCEEHAREEMLANEERRRDKQDGEDRDEAIAASKGWAAE